MAENPILQVEPCDEVDTQVDNESVREETAPRPEPKAVAMPSTVEPTNQRGRDMGTLYFWPSRDHSGAWQWKVRDTPPPQAFSNLPGGELVTPRSPHFSHPQHASLRHTTAGKHGKEHHSRTQSMALFVGCSSGDDEVAVVRIGKKTGDAVIVRLYRTPHNSFLDCLLSIDHVTSPDEQTAAMYGWVSEVVTSIFTQDLSDDEQQLDLVTDVAVSIDRLVASECNCNRSHGVLENIATVLRAAFIDEFHVRGIHLRSCNCVVEESSAIAARQLIAARQISSTPTLSSLIDIQSSHFEVVNDAFGFIHIRAGYDMDSSLRSKLWLDKICPAMRNFHSGDRIMFSGYFVESATMLFRWLKLRSFFPFSEIIYRLSMASLPVDEIRAVFASKAILDFVEFLETESEEENALALSNTLYLLQQIVLCGNLNAKATVVIREEYLYNGTSQRVCHALGWGLSCNVEKLRDTPS